MYAQVAKISKVEILKAYKSTSLTSKIKLSETAVGVPTNLVFFFSIHEIETFPVEIKLSELRLSAQGLSA